LTKCFAFRPIADCGDRVLWLGRTVLPTGARENNGYPAMADDPHITVKLDGDATSIEFPAEGLTTSATVTQIAERQYRLDSVPLFTELASFGDIIEADPVADGAIRFAESRRRRIGDFSTLFFRRRQSRARSSRMCSHTPIRLARIGNEFSEASCTFACPPEWIGTRRRNWRDNHALQRSGTASRLSVDSTSRGAGR